MISFMLQAGIYVTSQIFPRAITRHMEAANQLSLFLVIKNVHVLIEHSRVIRLS